MSEIGEKSTQRRLFELQQEHHDLNEVVDRLIEQGGYDQLLISRLKKRKLQLKDQISRLKSKLIPDLNA